MSNRSFESLVDLIYEASVVPERWHEILEELNAIGEGGGALIFTRSGYRDYWLATELASKVHQIGVESGIANPRIPRLFAAKHAGFITDQDVFTPEEIEREPYYTHFLRRQGFGWGTATAIEVPSGDVIAFNVERRYERGPVEPYVVEKLDRLRPHLARAALISARMMFERARSAAETLGLIGLPAVMLRMGGRPLTANRLFEDLMPDVAEEGRERLVLAEPAADVLFAEALQRIGRFGDPGGVRSIPVPAREGRPPAIVHLVPVRGAANDVFSGAASVLIVTPVERKKVPGAEVLQGLFDLTPAEARVARGIAEGRTLEAIALAAGVSQETVRSQLKAALGKTGMNRQAELAVLLSGLAPNLDL